MQSGVCCVKRDSLGWDILSVFSFLLHGTGREKGGRFRVDFIVILCILIIHFYFCESFC